MKRDVLKEARERFKNMTRAQRLAALAECGLSQKLNTTPSKDGPLSPFIPTAPKDDIEEANRVRFLNTSDYLTIGAGWRT